MKSDTSNAFRCSDWRSNWLDQISLLWMIRLKCLWGLPPPINKRFSPVSVTCICTISSNSFHEALRYTGPNHIAVDVMKTDISNAFRCSGWRSNWLDVVPSHFFPAPIPLNQRRKGRGGGNCPRTKRSP